MNYDIVEDDKGLESFASDFDHFLFLENLKEKGLYGTWKLLVESDMNLKYITENFEEISDVDFAKMNDETIEKLVGLNSGLIYIVQYLSNRLEVCNHSDVLYPLYLYVFETSVESLVIVNVKLKQFGYINGGDRIIDELGEKYKKENKQRYSKKGIVE